MNQTQLLEELNQAVIALDIDLAVQLTDDAMAAGMDPLVAIEQGLQPGIFTIGERFERLECFLPELIKSAKVFQAAMKVMEPVILARGSGKKARGVIVMGTVKGDIHKIGKDIVVMLWRTRGFEVHDLGEDIPASEFLKAAREHKADIVGLSALLNTTMPAQQDVIRLFAEQGVRDDYKILIGGAPVTQAWADQIGADGYAQTAQDGVTWAMEMLPAVVAA